MEFIEAKINPNSTLKMLSKRSRRGPLKVKQRRIKKAEKPNPRRNNLARPGTSLAGRPCWVLDAQSVRPIPARVSACFARVVRRFALLGARGFLDPLIFPKITFEVIFSIQTR